MSEVVQLHAPLAARRHAEDQFGILTGMLRTINFYDPGSARTYLDLMRDHGLLKDDDAVWLRAELRLDQPCRLRLDVPIGASPPPPSRPGLSWEGPEIGGYDDAG